MNGDNFYNSVKVYLNALEEIGGREWRITISQGYSIAIERSLEIGGWKTEYDGIVSIKRLFVELKSLLHDASEPQETENDV